MWLSVSPKVLIRRWTALRWGNTMMIRSQLWWHLRRNGKTQNSSTPFCLAACVCPCGVWVVLCWPTSTKHPCPRPSWFNTDCCISWCCLSVFVNEKSAIVDYCNEKGTPWWPGAILPNPVYLCESSLLSLMALVTVSPSRPDPTRMWDKHLDGNVNIWAHVNMTAWGPLKIFSTNVN